ncbi:MAG: phosphatidylinositol-specific phospholipase C domain-containing protein [Candidatus Helarchaeota archaeon]
MAEKYNRAIFKTTHNSYSGGTRKSINYQLDSKIRGIEFDIHSGEEEASHPRKREYKFMLGHNYPKEDVFLGEMNPNSISLETWLEIIMKWSQLHPDHEPITLCLDIKGNLVDNTEGLSLKMLNLLVRHILDGKLYTPKDYFKWNHNSLEDSEWPTVDKLKGKIVVFFTGEHNTKWVYWNEMPIREQNCFIAYSYEDDGGKAYSNEMLQDAPFVNCHLSYWRWGKAQFEKGKVLRLWEFNPFYDNRGFFQYPTTLNRKGLICNFPATDTPFEPWYLTAFPYLC